MSRRVRTVVCSAALAVVALGAGCGIPTDDNPRAISRENVPDEAVDATTESTESQETVAVPISLVQSPEDPRLVDVERRVPVSNPSAGPDPAAVLETLLRAAPNARERSDGVTNLIPEDTRLASQPELARGTLVVDLTNEIFDVEGETQRAAFGQIVCTANKLDGVDSVRFLIQGEPREVQADSGATGGPVTCAGDYQRLQSESDAG
ncbi:MAG TPA: GerMN domain-containing protein [Acidimicrobiales bacterium]|nr:GerMN domain-containing protein [Acidimicrobiales bacterium]